MTKLNFPLQFQKQYSGPLDADMVFDSYADLQNFKNEARSYPGMLVTCTEAGYEGKIFILNADKSM
jgi:hypothetical protein